MPENKPLVTIGVASYNNAEFILETLNSVNDQTYPNIELIIIDDLSKDNSRLLIDNWKLKSRYPVKTIFNEKNLGIPKVCNVILNACDSKSAYLCLFSSDDILLKDRIDKQVAILEDAPDSVAGTFGDALIVNNEGEEIMSSYYSMMGTNFLFYTDLFGSSNKNSVLSEIIKHNKIPAISMIYRTSVIRKLGGWNEQYFMEDLDMNLRLLNNGYTFIPIKDPIVKHRKHSSSATTVKRVGYLTSILDIVSQYRGTNDQIDESIRKNYMEYALAVYQRGGKNAAPYLLQKFRFQKNVTNYFMYLLALVNIPFSWIRPIYSLFSRNKPL
ncbi:MAG: glycosyltransferase [Chitinophagaceae bacterium]|nr:glycosyltransferase [Chitinophagaceae bacterium]